MQQSPHVLACLPNQEGKMNGKGRLHIHPQHWEVPQTVLHRLPQTLRKGPVSMKGPLSESYHCKALISQTVFKYVFLFAKLKFLRNKIQESKWNIMGQWIDRSILLSGTRTLSLYTACLFWGKREGEEKLLENEGDDSFLQDAVSNKSPSCGFEKEISNIYHLCDKLFGNIHFVSFYI